MQDNLERRDDNDYVEVRGDVIYATLVNRSPSVAVVVVVVRNKFAA